MCSTPIVLNSKAEKIPLIRCVVHSTSCFCHNFQRRFVGPSVRQGPNELLSVYVCVCSLFIMSNFSCQCLCCVSHNGIPPHSCPRSPQKKNPETGSVAITVPFVLVQAGLPVSEQRASVCMCHAKSASFWCTAEN